MQFNSESSKNLSITVTRNKCGHRRVVCPQNCGEMVQFRHLNKHSKDDCNNTLVDCPLFPIDEACFDCTGQVLRGQFDAHTSEMKRRCEEAVVKATTLEVQSQAHKCD